MSADAFKELTDSKVTNDKDYTGTDKTLSALAFKEYLKEKLVSYAKISDSVWYDSNVQLGSDHQGIYVDTDGKAKPVNVIYRGNRTNDENALVIVPTLGADGLWYFDYIKRSDLYKSYLSQLYFTFHIEQSAHQIITVTYNGNKYTSDFNYLILLFLYIIVLFF